jgi:hypothetical protein
MEIIGPFLLFACLTWTIALVGNLDFAEAAPLSLMGSILVLYVFGLFNLLWLGVIILIIAPLAILLLKTIISLIAYRLQPKELGQFRNSVYLASLGSVGGTFLGYRTHNIGSFIGPSFWTFAVLYSYLATLNQYRGFDNIPNWDDFLFWGPMVKEMVRLGNFYDLPDSMATIHQDYPPALSIFRFLFCNLQGGYSESACYTSIEFLVCGLILSILVRQFTRSSVGVQISTDLMALGACIVIPLLFSSFGTMYLSVSADNPLGLMGGYYLFLCYDTLKPNHSFSVILSNNPCISKFELGFASALMPLIKPVGMFYVLMGLCIYLLIKFFRVIQLKISSHTKPNNGVGLEIYSKPQNSCGEFLVLLVGFISFGIWQNRTKVLGTASQGSFNIEAVMKIITGPREEYQDITSSNYATVTENSPIHTIFPLEFFGLSEPVSFNYLQLGLCFLIIVVVLKIFILDFWSFLRVGSIVFFSAFGYALMMWFLYQTQFSPNEAMELASYERYMMTIWSSLFIFLVLIAVTSIRHTSFSKKKHAKKRAHVRREQKSVFQRPEGLNLFTVWVSCLILAWHNWPILTPPTQNLSLSKILEPASVFLLDSVPERSWVSVLTKNSLVTLIVNYHTFQSLSTDAFYYRPAPRAEEETQYMMQKLYEFWGLNAPLSSDQENYAKYIYGSDFDYIYVLDPEETTAANLSPLFTDWANNTIYKITDSGQFIKI